MALYYRTLIVTLYPVGFGLILSIFWFFYKKLYNSNKESVFDSFLITLSITVSYFLCPIINALAGFINCMELNNESYIQIYLLEKCTHNPRYALWRNLLVIPSFAIYGIFFPCLVFSYMYKNKENLFEKKILKKIIFLLNGYSPSTFYWYVI